MAIVIDYPEQVLVLKGTRTLCGFNARGPGLQRRMIDERETKEFATFCRALRVGADRQLQEQFDGYVAAATEQMNKMLADAGTIGHAIELVAKTYDDKELLIFRRGERYTGEMLDKMIQDTMQLAGEMWKAHPNAHPLRPTEDYRNGFIFRAALCGYLLALRWIAVGGAAGATAKKLRNDMVDVNFAATATYFDGLLSADQKLIAIYNEARYLLDTLYVPRHAVEARSNA
jgi:hypothetical protein